MARRDNAQRWAKTALREGEELKKLFEAQRDQVREATERAGVKKIDDAFDRHTAGVEDELAKRTIGLKKRDEYTREREKLEGERQADPGAADAKREGAPADDDAERKRKKKKAKKKPAATGLSFELDEDVDEELEGAGPGEASPLKLAKVKKNPSVDTDFLPDREREAAEQERRRQLQAEWEAEQTRVKGEEIDVTYSYWDGAGHRFTTRVTKGTSIGGFLNKCRGQVKQLRNASVDQLMFIKEDVILPQNLTFYDLIVNKARGKSGPLFAFDVHDDVRLTNDVRVEKDETHAGKVVEKRWYEHNKERFPASRWEVYDPAKKYDTYTIHGGENYGMGVHTQLL